MLRLDPVAGYTLPMRGGKHGSQDGAGAWDELSRLGPEHLLARASAVEALRARTGTPGHEDPLPAWWRGFHGRDEPQLWGTPFEWLAGLIAASQGVVAFDRLERTLLPTPASWVSEELSGSAEASIYRVVRGPERIDAHPLWPFAFEGPLADYTGSAASKWWSHALIHALIGANLRPDMTEWEVMADVRFSEAVAAVHWYCLAELGRLGDGDLPLDLADLRGEEAVRYAGLARQSLDPRLRALRLSEPTSAHIAANALELLRYERFAWHAALTGGRLLEPGGTSLGLGESSEYARVHARRLRSNSTLRWVRFCRRGRDAEARDLEARAGEVLDALLFRSLEELFEEAEREGASRRFRRILQDLGSRLCQAEAFEGDGVDRYGPALQLISQQLDAELRDAGAMREALSELAAVVVRDSAGAALSASDILSQGVAPLITASGEPAPVRQARRDARIRRGRAWHPALGRTLAAMPTAVERSLDAPVPRDWLRTVVSAAEVEAREGRVTWEAYGYVGWLLVAASIWLEGAVTPADERWLERLSRRSLPSDRSSWGRFELVWNPRLQRVPMPFDATWDEAFARSPVHPEASARFKPRPAHAIWYALVGAGRLGPVYLPLTPRWSALISRLKRVARLDEVVAEPGLDEAFIAEALAAEAVLLVERPKLDLPERPIDVLEVAMAAASSVDQRREPEGPWADPGMAEAYVAFCRRYSLYRDTSEALCDVADIGPDSRVAELGFGTGETTRAILRRLGPQGRVLAADPALCLVSGIMDHVHDSRARFLPGSARALLHVAVTDCHFDIVIANSAMVLIDDLPDALAHCYAMLRAGGRLAFSVQAEVLGDVEHLVGEGQISVLAALESARASLGFGRPEASNGLAGRALGTQGALRETLRRCGFDGIGFTRFARPWTVDEYFAWLDLPAVRRAMVAASEADRSGELIALARASVRDDLQLETAWWLVTAQRPEEAEG